MSKHVDSWANMLREICKYDGEDFSKLVCTLSAEELEIAFDCGYGGAEGKPFTAWGKRWVYFPLEYDGFESVGHAPRNPCDIVMDHQ